jgi:hypothetical protein
MIGVTSSEKTKDEKVEQWRTPKIELPFMRSGYHEMNKPSVDVVYFAFRMEALLVSYVRYM